MPNLLIPVYVVPIYPDAFFGSLETQRKNGTLSGNATNAAYRYQVSAKHPGYLDRIDRQGNITTGRFANGQFILLDKEIA